MWKVLRVPMVEEKDTRQLPRELQTLRKEQTAHVNCIKGLLAGYGLTVAVGRFFPKRLKELRLCDGSALPAELHARLLREFQRMQVVNRQIHVREQQRVRRIRKDQQDPALEKVRRLLRLKGIGVNSSWLYVREVFGWRDLKNRRQVGAIVGPCERTPNAPYSTSAKAFFMAAAVAATASSAGIARRARLKGSAEIGPS